MKHVNSQQALHKPPGHQFYQTAGEDKFQQFEGN